MKSNNKPVYIVTGAAGHLGRTVTRKLSESGNAVYAFCLPDETYLPNGENVRVFYGDVRNIDSLTEMFEACANAPVFVIHCAGIVSISSKFDQMVYDVNVNGTKNIIALCEKYNVQKLIYISSVHALPVLPDAETIIEVDHFSPDDVVGLYSKTKSEASQCVLDYVKRGYNANIIHPSGLIGPEDFGRGHLTQLIIDYCKGGLTSGIDGGYDFVDVRDVTDGILSCCEHGENGACYIMSGRYMKVYDLLNQLHEITGKKKIERMLPLWFVKLTAPLSELYYKILRQPPLFTTYSIYTLNVNAIFSYDKAKNDLNYTTRPIRQTLEDTVTWLKENSRIP